MSSKLDINRGSKNLSITINMVIITVLGSGITIPARATSLYNPNSDAIPNQELLKLLPNSQALYSQNNEEQNDIQYRLFKEMPNTIDQLKQASQVTQVTIGDKIIYSYSLETAQPVGVYSNNTNISGAYQSPWKLPAPAPRRKVSEPATGVGLLVALAFFAKRRKLK